MLAGGAADGALAARCCASLRQLLEFDAPAAGGGSLVTPTPTPHQMQWLNSYEADFGIVEGSGVLRVCHSLCPANEGALWSTIGAATRSNGAGAGAGVSTDHGMECATWVEARGWAGWGGAGASSHDERDGKCSGRSARRTWKLVESGGQCNCPPFAI